MANNELLQQRIDSGIKLVEDRGLYKPSDYTKYGLLAVAYSGYYNDDKSSILDLDPSKYPEVVLIILATQYYNPRIGIVTRDEVDLLLEQYGEHAAFVINLLAVSRNPDSGYSELKISKTNPVPINEVLISTLTNDPLLTKSLIMYGKTVYTVLHDLSDHILNFDSGITEFAGLNIVDKSTPDETEEHEEVDHREEEEEVKSEDETINADNQLDHLQIYNYIDKYGKYDINNYSEEQLEYLTTYAILGYDLDKMLELNPSETSIYNMIYYSACLIGDDLDYNPLPDYIGERVGMDLLVITLSDDPRSSDVRKMLDDGVPTSEIAKALASDSVVLSRIAEDYPEAIFNIVSAIVTLPPNHPLKVLGAAIEELNDSLPPLPDKYRV